MNWRTLLEIDDQWSRRVQLAEDRRALRRVAAFFAHSGDSWFWLIGLGLIWLFGTPTWHQRSALLIVGLVVLAVVVLAIKFTIRRRRPEGTWGNVYRATDPHSFPSGHASRAAMLAVVALGLGPTWFSLLLLVWAPLVATARVLMGVHYLSDVIAGLIFGALVGILILAVYPILLSWVPPLLEPIFF